MSGGNDVVRKRTERNIGNEDGITLCLFVQVWLVLMVVSRRFCVCAMEVPMCEHIRRFSGRLVAYKLLSLTETAGVEHGCRGRAQVGFGHARYIASCIVGQEDGMTVRLLQG